MRILQQERDRSGRLIARKLVKSMVVAVTVNGKTSFYPKFTPLANVTILSMTIKKEVLYLFFYLPLGPDLIVTICNFFHCSTDYLYFGEEREEMNGNDMIQKITTLLPKTPEEGGAGYVVGS